MAGRSVHRSAVQAAEAIRTGKITSVELVRACLARIQEFDGEIQAWAHLDGDLALEYARLADDVHKSGRNTGPLHGVPVGIKDIIDTFDYPTTFGTALCADRQPTQDATLVATLREAGAIILGKTVASELAVYTPGPTRNPHNPAHTPGGSSSGSAAAVAAFMTPLSVGTQTNGSIIRPASFCGVYGFKPSFGRISRHGILAQSHKLDTAGVFARDLADLALIADVLMEYDQQDPDMVIQPRPAVSRTLNEPLPADPRFAFVRSPVWSRAEEYTRDAFRELIEFAGNRIDIVDLPDSFEEALDLHRIIFESDLANSYAELYNKGNDLISSALGDIIMRGKEISVAEYESATGKAADLAAVLEEYFYDYDAILTPSATGEAPGLETTGDPAFCTIWTLCGMPALNLPIFEGPGNLPLGAQLVGAAGDDARLFRSARWLLEYIDQQQ